MLLYKTLSRFSSFQIFVWTFYVYTFVSPPSSSARSTQSMPTVRKNKKWANWGSYLFFPLRLLLLLFYFISFYSSASGKNKKKLFYFFGNNWYYRNQISWCNNRRLDGDGRRISTIDITWSILYIFKWRFSRYRLLTAGGRVLFDERTDARKTMNYILDCWLSISIYNRRHVCSIFAHHLSLIRFRWPGRKYIRNYIGVRQFLNKRNDVERCNWWVDDV